MILLPVILVQTVIIIMKIAVVEYRKTSLNPVVPRASMFTNNRSWLDLIGQAAAAAAVAVNHFDFFFLLL